MSDKNSALQEAINKLKQERDELKLQMHLASMEARDEYDRLSNQCDKLSEEYAPLQDAVEETAENVWTALGMVAEELKVGFTRVRKAVTEKK